MKDVTILEIQGIKCVPVYQVLQMIEEIQRAGCTHTNTIDIGDGDHSVIACCDCGGKVNG